MKVLFLSQIVPYPPHGGVLQRGYNVLRELGGRAEVALCAYVHPDEMPTPEAVAASRQAMLGFCQTVDYVSLWPKQSAVHRVAALALSATSSTPFSVIAHRSASLRRIIAARTAATRFDVIHVDTLALMPFVPPSSDAGTVLTHHNIESSLMERRAHAERQLLARAFLTREARKLRAYERFAARTCDVNITVSTPDAELLKGLAPEARTWVVPNGVDTSYFMPDGTAEEPALIYAGGMNMFANRDAVTYFVREIWPQIRAAVPGVRFYAVGQDPPAELRAFADTDPQITVTGKVPDVRPFIRRAAIYVVPLRVGGGTRLKVLDGLSLGKAMVSTTIGCEGIAVTPGTHLLVADEPARFAHHVVSLLQQPEARRRLGAAGRALIEERYAWPVIGGQLMAAYEDAMSRKNRS